MAKTVSRRVLKNSVSISFIHESFGLLLGRCISLARAARSATVSSHLCSARVWAEKAHTWWCAHREEEHSWRAYRRGQPRWAALRWHDDVPLYHFNTVVIKVCLREFKNGGCHKAQWYRPVIIAFRRWRQEDLELEVSMSYIETVSQKRQ